MWPSLGNDDLICIGIDHQVCIVRHHDHLPVGLGLDEQVHELVEDRLGVEILFGLIYHQWSVIVVVQCEI